MAACIKSALTDQRNFREIPIFEYREPAPPGTARGRRPRDRGRASDAAAPPAYNALRKVKLTRLGPVSGCSPPASAAMP